MENEERTFARSIRTVTLGGYRLGCVSHHHARLVSGPGVYVLLAASRPLFVGESDRLGYGSWTSGAWEAALGLGMDEVAFKLIFESRIDRLLVKDFIRRREMPILNPHDEPCEVRWLAAGGS